MFIYKTIYYCLCLILDKGWAFALSLFRSLSRTKNERSGAIRSSLFYKKSEKSDLLQKRAQGRITQLFKKKMSDSLKIVNKKSFCSISYRLRSRFLLP